MHRIGSPGDRTTLALDDRATAVARRRDHRGMGRQ